MFKKCLTIVITLCSTILCSQNIIVLDKITQQTVPGVTVYSNNPKLFAVTNAKGIIDGTTFQSADSIFFKCLGYETMVLSYKQIESMKFKVLLKESNISLGEIIISANKWSENKLETPSRIEKIDMKNVALQNPQTTADLLGTSGYAFIQKSQLGGGSPMLRGMATNRVLLVVDGVRMNNAIFRSGNLQNVISLDANALEGTEILFGPGSVMYGSDAIGGVMTFRTLEPKLSDTTKMIVLGNALMRTSTANSEVTGHLDFNIGLKKWAFTTSITKSNYGDLRSGSRGGVNEFYRSKYVETSNHVDYILRNEDSTLQIGSKYSQINFMQKIRFAPNKFWDLEYGFHISETSPYDRYDRLYVIQTQSGPYKDKLRWAEWYYGPQIWKMHRLGVTHSKPTIAYDHLRIIGAMQDFEESRYDREFMNRYRRMQKETVKAFSFNVDLDKELFKKLTVYYGGEYVHNTVGSFAEMMHIITEETDSTVTRYPNGSTWESYGAYVSLKYKLTKNIIVNGGGRYSYYKIRATFDTTFFPFPYKNGNMENGSFSGSLGFIFTPHRTWQIYLNGSTGYRAPNIDDMGKVFESTPGYLVVPNPKLKPEQAYNAEIGTVKSFGKFLRVDAAGYYTYLKDAMERKDFTLNGQTSIRYLGNKSNIQAVQNVGLAYVYGIQAGFEFNYKGFGLKSTYSYQYGKEQSPDSLIYYPLRHAAPMFGSAHLTYERKKLNFDFYVLYNGKMDYEDLALTERVNPSYAKDYTVNYKGIPYAASWYTLNFKVALYINQNVALMLGVENIEDRLYRPYSSGINAPGRNFIGSLRAKF